MSLELQQRLQQRVKILLVDDRPENLTALEAALESLGPEVVRAESGAEALRRVLADEFAVILLDVRMPGIDGLETAALIRQRENSRNTPIIFLTAYKDDEQLFRGYDLGAVDYLVKPVIPEILRSKVSVFVELARKNQLLQQHSVLLEAKNVELKQAIAKRKKAEQELEDRLRELKAANVELEKLYSRVKELDRLKTDFFANISHEFRTPLALMLGPIEKLLADGSSDEQQRNLEIVQHSTRILLKRVNDLLDLSRIDAAGMNLSFVDIDLTGLVRQTAAHFDGLARERWISFAVDAPDAVPAQVDPEKIERVLLNLLSNAFKFVPDGGEVKCALTVSGSTTQIVVEDSGPGIPVEARDRVFERFRQAESGPKFSFTGTGLGLSIIKEFVELHHGAVEVGDSGLGGALFRVELPLSAPPDATINAQTRGLEERAPLASAFVQQLRASQEQETAPATTAASGRPSVLIVEDNPTMRRFLSDALSADYHVVGASGGKEGLEAAIALEPDLILSDLMMPEMRGEQLIRELRARPELESTPVVVLTALADQDLRTTLLNDGVQDYLTKPFSLAEMRARIHNLVAMKRARDVLRREAEVQTKDIEQLAREVSLRRQHAQEALREAVAANQAKDEFLATISHELRTPLTSVLGWARLLRAGDLDAETTSRALETIERNAKTQCQIIEDILDAARIVAGKLQLALRPVELAGIIHDAVETLRPTAQVSGVHIDMSLNPGAGLVQGDPDRLQQVVWNLLSNAIKFTPRGGRAEIILRGSAENVELVVTDTGRGISAEFLPHVFERFRQADSSTSRAHGGLGLGLAIVRHLVEAHGGTVYALSEGEGHGATFTVKLPSLPTVVAERKISEVPCNSTKLTGLHLLLVEDDIDTRELLHTMLVGSGAAVTTAGSVRQALQLFRQSRPDAVLCDIEMPGEDGYALIRKIRGLEAGSGRRTPVAAVTAHASPDDCTRTLAVGFDMHVAKPIEPEALAASVMTLVHRVHYNLL